jgi:twinkle protein
MSATNIDMVSKTLANQAEAVAALLLPCGKRERGEWHAGDLSGTPGRSLKVHLEGPRAGLWRDWASADEDRGDLLDLWSRARNITLAEALQQARHWLGLALPVSQARSKDYAKPRPSELACEIGRVRKYLTEQRQLTHEIVNRFRIGVVTREEEGRKCGYIVFPSYSPGGELINNSYCALERAPDGKKKVRQEKGCAPSLFGWQALSERAYESRAVIICEGQIDAMSWAHWGFDCLSIPNGSSNTWIEYEWENLAVFRTIYLSYDMDGKLSGVQEQAISRLGRHRCLLLKLPHKDANDCLKAGMTGDEMTAIVAAAEPPRLANFATLKDLKDRVMAYFFPVGEKKLLQPALLGSQIPGRTFAVRPGEVSLWTGISSHGKSTFLAQLFMELVMLDQNVMINSFEMKPERIVKKMAMGARDGGPESCEDLLAFLDIVGERICFCDKVGSIAPGELLEMMDFAYARYGVTQFLIDSLMRIDGLEEDYKAQGAFLNSLCTFAGERMVHIHLVAHPRKTFEDGRPSGNDLKGSSLLRNNADNIFIVHRNTAKEKNLADGSITQEEADAEWDTSVLVDKDREEGTVRMFRFKFDPESHRFLPMIEHRDDDDPDLEPECETDEEEAETTEEEVESANRELALAGDVRSRPAPSRSRRRRARGRKKHVSGASRR